MIGLLAALVLQSGAPELTIAYVSTPKVKFDGWEQEESTANLQLTIEQTVLSQLAKKGVNAEGSKFIDLLAREERIDLSSSKNRNLESYARLGTQANSPRLMIIEVNSFQQKNTSPADLLNNPNKKGSQTEVQVRFELFDIKSSSLSKFGNQRKLEGKFAAGYFGTTKRTDLSGDPSGVATMIRLTNTKKMEAIGLAVWAAIEFPLMNALGKN